MLSLGVGSILFRLCNRSSGADLPNANGFSESVLIGAFEKGCSLVIAEILSVREDKPTKFYFYKAKIIRPIILGDVASGDLHGSPEFFADSPEPVVLKVGHTYALFIRKPDPYQLCLVDRDDAVEIDISDKTKLKGLKQAAMRAYQKTSIYSFRKNMPGIRSSLPELPEALSILCERFRRRPTDRAEYARQIFQSDLGSRIVHNQAQPGPVNYYAPKIALSRWQVLHLLGAPGHKSGWTYSWFCGSDKHAPEADKYVGVLSATFNENEMCIRLVYETQERGKWARPDEEKAAKRELADQAKAVMLKFQQALKDSDWERALSLCSQKVKRKAKQSDSAEAFFKSVVPIQEVISFSDFRVRGWSSGGGGIERYHYYVGVRVPERDFADEWEWTIVRTRAGWFVDFKPYSLEVWMKHQKIRYRYKPGKPLVSREKRRKGLEIRLVPISEEFVIGEPMLFRLEMTNVGDETLPYWPTSYMVNDPMIVKGPNGKSVAFMGGSCQTAVWLEFIEPGETIILVGSYDVTSQYDIVSPGKYSFQFKRWIKPSNIVEVDIKPGELSPAESLVQILTPILPECWEITRHVFTPDPFSSRQPDRCLLIGLIGQQGLKGLGGRFGMSIFIFLDDEKSQIEYKKRLGEFWGNCKWGPVYVNAYGAELLWPDYREQIVEVLGIREVQPD
jgi:hypothetical protein